jgi:hypothetical protein
MEKCTVQADDIKTEEWVNFYRSLWNKLNHTPQLEAALMQMK